MSTLTRREIEKALEQKRDTYPNMIECEICGEIWMSHNGSICPICSVCAAACCQHIESCSICTAAANAPELGLQMCDLGRELARCRHGLNHSKIPLPGRSLEVIEVREGAGVFWHLCSGGVTLFLPRLQVSTDFLN